MSLESFRKRCSEFLSPQEIRENELLAPFTTFRVGGPADLFIRPEGKDAVAGCLKVLQLAREEQVEVFVLGGGSNVLIADRGVRGVVLATTGCKNIFQTENGGCSNEASRSDSSQSAGTIQLVAECGAEVDSVVNYCADRSIAGMEFIAGMPGTIGGAVWMNARCYGVSISDFLVETNVLDESGREVSLPFNADEFGYKRSPFQQKNLLILSAKFSLSTGNQNEIIAAGEAHRADRKAKGHYRLPSAGSTFKNNREWGKPTGQIVDELGLKGLRVGGAAVAPWHGNILVNENGATAADIRRLVDEVSERVHAALGITLEPEILFVGDWH